MKMFRRYAVYKEISAECHTRSVKTSQTTSVKSKKGSFFFKQGLYSIFSVCERVE
jgi:hypothetical protein